MRNLLLATLMVLYSASASAIDADYGLVESMPVKVGGVYKEGVARNRMYLSRLKGPNGESVRFARLGSCCHFKTPNSRFNGNRLLDMYEATYEDLSKPIIIYINVYDEEKVFPVKGLFFPC